MYSRRSILALSGAAALAGCGAPALLSEDQQRSLRVEQVRVDVSALPGITGGRNISVTPDRVGRDVQAVLQSQLLPASASGERAAVVTVRLETVRLVTPGERFAIGGASGIDGVLLVTDAVTGQPILPPTEVAGLAKGGWRPGGLIGVLTTPPPNEDYEAALAGFAEDIAKRLLGRTASS